MKRPLLILAGGVLSLGLFTSTAFAGWSIGFGIHNGGVSVRGSYHRDAHGSARHRHRSVHKHVRVPIYKQVWVPPVTKRVFVGRTHSGRPVFRTVLVRRGYTTKVLVGYRCRHCGSGCR